MEYMTVAECFKANAERHMANCRRHAAEGRHTYAFGSWKKAQRNFRRAWEVGSFSLIFKAGELA